MSDVLTKIFALLDDTSKKLSGLDLDNHTPRSNLIEAVSPALPRRSSSTTKPIIGRKKSPVSLNDGIISNHYSPKREQKTPTKISESKSQRKQQTKITLNKKKETRTVDSHNEVTSSTANNIAATSHSSCRFLENKIMRTVSDTIPEVHYIGEMHSFIGIKHAQYMSCEWKVDWGKSWSLLEGDVNGQTQFSYQESGIKSTWNHPIDLHFACASIQGWPRLQLKLWELDQYGRCLVTGYGFAHLPSSPGNFINVINYCNKPVKLFDNNSNMFSHCFILGFHEISVACWRPAGSFLEEMRAFFLGTSAGLADEDLIFDKAWSTRNRLVTVPSGQVSVRQRFLSTRFSTPLLTIDIMLLITFLCPFRSK